MFRHLQLGLLKSRLFVNPWMLKDVLSKTCLRPYAKTNNYGGLLMCDPFVLPNDVAMADNCKLTATVDCEYEHNIKIDDIDIYIQPLKCPLLMRNYVYELFSSSTKPGFKPNLINIINIRYHNPRERNTGVAVDHFIHMAKEMSHSLQKDFWADFINPMNGRPFFSGNAIKKKYTVDCRCRGINMEFGKIDRCLIIKPNLECSFAGAVFTTAPLHMFHVKKEKEGNLL